MMLRPYRHEDLDALYAIDAVCFEEPFRFSRAVLERFIAKDFAHTIVAEDASGIAGFITTHLESGVETFGYVVTLDVLRPYRRNGLGSWLLLEGERLAGAAGATSTRLHVHSVNHTALSFYAHLEYRCIGMVPDYYGRTLDAFVLEKPLAKMHRVLDTVGIEQCQGA